MHLPLLICTPTAPHPDGPPWLTALYASFGPWPCALFEALLVTLTTPLSIHLNFISTVVCLHAFFIDLLFVAYQGFIPCPWDCISEPWDWLVSLRCSDIVCSWNKRKCHLGCSLFHSLSDGAMTGFLFASLLWNFPPQLENKQWCLYIQRQFKQEYSLKWL